MTDQEWDLVEALAWSAYTTYSATLVGNPAPYVKNLFEWLKTIEVGALVMETSTMYRRTEHNDAIGIVEKLETRVVCQHEHKDPNLESCPCNGDEATGQYRWTEHYTWLRTRTGRHRWYNADFIRIPRNQREAREPKTDVWEQRAAALRAERETLLAIERRDCPVHRFPSRVI